MAKSKTSDIVKITISTRNIPDIDPITKQPTGTFRNILKNNLTDLRSIERVLQSAVNEPLYFREDLRTVDPNNGVSEQSFFIKRKDLDNTYGTIMSKVAELSSKRGGAYAIDVHSAEEIKTTKTIYGKDAQKKAIEELNRFHGKATVNASNPDKLDIILPYDKSALAGMNQSQKSALIEKYIPKARELSNTERKTRKKEEEDKKIKEQEKRTANELKLIKEQNIAKAKARKEADKLIEDANKKAEADRKKKDKERKKKAEAEKKEAKAKKAKAKKDTKKAIAKTKAILAVITVIADIVRRILTASLKQATENNKMAVEAHSVGVTSLERRSYDIFDLAHGMEKGSTFGAIQAVQGMFGDATNLDEKALGTLARVMGSEIGSLVRSGMGGQNPDKLLDKILDKYFKQFLSGKNSLGQSVGMEQARRELITTLQSVSPEIAKLFARMVDDYTSGYYKPFKDSAGWRDTTKTNITGLSEADQKFSTEVGKKYNEIIAIVEDLKTSFFTRLANSMDDLLTKVKNIRINQSEEDKIDTDRKNKLKNEESIAIMQNQLKLYNSNSAEKIKELGSIENTPLSKGVTKFQAERFQYTAEILAGIQSGIYDEEYFTENINGTGILNAKKEVRKAEAKAYVARGKALAVNAMFNAEVQDEIAYSTVNLDQIAKLKETNKNKVGSGEIDDLSITEAKRTYLAQELLEKHNRGIANHFAHNQAIDTAGSEVKETIIQGYVDFFKENPDAFYDATANMLPSIKKKFTRVATRIAKEKGVKKLKDLTNEDKYRAFAEVVSDWRSRDALPVAHKVTDTFIMKRAGIDAINNINMSDSKILNLLARQNATLAPNTSYSTYGSQGQSGEYLLKIQMLDNSGRETGQPIPMTFSNTKGINGYQGKVITDSKGNVVFATTN